MAHSGVDFIGTVGKLMLPMERLMVLDLAGNMHLS
jgi:hypothetical protein